MKELSKKHCVPCEGGMPPLTKEQIAEYTPGVKGWKVSPDDKKITKEFKFKNFVEAMAFVNNVAAIAEEEGHHPDMHIFYNLVRFELSTHAVKGLSENDFIVAAKIDALTRT